MMRLDVVIFARPVPCAEVILDRQRTVTCTQGITVVGGRCGSGKLSVAEAGRFSPGVRVRAAPPKRKAADGNTFVTANRVSYTLGDRPHATQRSDATMPPMNMNPPLAVVRTVCQKAYEVCNSNARV